MGSADLVPEPDLPGRAERPDTEHPRRLHGVPREVDPEERGQAYETACAYADSDAAEQQDYQAEVPRFARMWAEHEQRWPAQDRASSTADRTADADGSFRSDGGFYLGPERNTQADTAIARMRSAEPAISADLRTIENQNAAGARLEGFSFRIKGADRLKEKVAEQLTTGSPDATPAEVLRQLPDAIRYTLSATPSDFCAS